MSITPVGSNAQPALAPQVMPSLPPQATVAAPQTSTLGTGAPAGDQLSFSSAALRRSQGSASTAYLRDAVLTRLMNGESQASDPASLRGLLGSQGVGGFFRLPGEVS